MDFLDVILTRRSIRHFRKTIVESDKIETLLRSAMYAPSAGNKQPWYFVVIDDRKKLDKIMEMHANAWMLETASHAILICANENLQHGPGYWIADCGAATENMLLAANSIGLGACWIGLYPRENRMKAISEMLNLPPDIRVFSLVAIGYADEVKEKPERYKPERVFYNEWENPF